MDALDCLKLKFMLKTFVIKNLYKYIITISIGLIYMFVIIFGYHTKKQYRYQHYTQEKRGR
jgi:hypothetical protein